MDLDYYLAKRILPKIKAYRENYLERDVREIPPLIFQGNQAFHNVPLVCSEGEMSDEEKAWIAVMDEIIFAMRWRLEASGNDYSPKRIAFLRNITVNISLMRMMKINIMNKFLIPKNGHRKALKHLGSFSPVFGIDRIADCDYRDNFIIQS
jgi:hypothetical protein